MNKRNPESIINQVESGLKLPRKNGEMVFDHPWESRIFAMAVLLFEKGKYPWKEFNHEFVKKIGEAESQNPQTEQVSKYYHHWLEAFEQMLLKKDLLTPEQIESRSEEFATGKRNHVC